LPRRPCRKKERMRRESAFTTAEGGIQEGLKKRNGKNGETGKTHQDNS